MIPFFRKIRKQFADDNKPVKYLRYAIGEVVLVVIGILIALSINNWNNQRLFNEKVISQLKTLSSELTDDIAKIDFRISIWPRNVAYLQKLSKGEYEGLDLSLFYTIVAGMDAPVLFGDTYTILKNNGGIDMISDLNLKAKLSEYNDYDREFINHLIRYGVSTGIAYRDETVESFLEYDTDNKLVRENTIKVIKEKKLNNIINSQLILFKLNLEQFRSMSRKAEILKKQLDEYIDEQE